jgi:hypothetical protein
MGMSERTRRRAVLLGLAGFVVVVGGASWLIGGGLRGTRLAHPVTAFTEPTSTPMDCPFDHLALVGGLNECVKVIPDASSTCSVSGHTLDAVLRLSGGDLGAWLYIEINGADTGPGSYDLPPWPGPLGASDGEPKVAIQQDGTGAIWQYVNGGPILRYGTDESWQSVAGVLTITGSDGRSGTLAAILQLSTGHNTTVSSSTISVAGPWRCG